MHKVLSKIGHVTAGKIAPTLVLFLLLTAVRAQPPAFKMLTYIETFSATAIHQMVEFRVPASVTLAQAIIESNSGESDLAKKSNNHFGIKCHMEWGGDTVIKHDDSLNECFRKYLKIEDSYTDHSKFLASRARYAPLFELPVTDYKAWCTGLKNCGYATYSCYAEDLINIIENAKLYELDGYEYLPAMNISSLRDQEATIKPKNYSNIPLEEFHRAELLWIDERDMLIRSLELLIESRADTDGETSSQ